MLIFPSITFYLLFTGPYYFFGKAKPETYFTRHIALFRPLVQGVPCHLILGVVVVPSHAIRRSTRISIKDIFEWNGHFTKEVSTKSILVPNSDGDESG
jgi:hypothetical protein